MNKLIIASAIGLSALGAHAQSNPPGAAVPPNSPGYAMGKPETAGEARKNARSPGMLPVPAANNMKSAESGAIGTDRAAAAGQARAETRDQRRPGKPDSMQGGTPK